MRASHIDMFENVDIIQVGARNMQNFELLKELGKLISLSFSREVFPQQSKNGS